MPSHSRRELLRSLGGVAALSASALAGCVDGSPGRDDDGGWTTGSTETRSATDRKSTTEPTETTRDDGTRRLGDARVSVTDPVARKAVAYESAMGSGGVLAPDGRQFVVVAVRSAVGTEAFGAGGEPPRDAFSLVAGDEPYPAVDIESRTTGAYTSSLAGRGVVGYDTSYDAGRYAGWLAFEPPSPLDVDAAEIRCEFLGETATWALPTDAVETLARPSPSFELESFGAEPTESGQVTLSLVAENTGDVDGEFLAAIYWPTARIADDDESIIVRRNVAAGGRVEWRKTVDTRYTASEDGPVTARLDGVVTGSATVEVDAATTTR